MTIQANHHALYVLADVLMQIRGLASGPIGKPHACALCPPLSHKAALEAIYALADAAHNIPTAVVSEPQVSAYDLKEELGYVDAIQQQIRLHGVRFGT